MLGRNLLALMSMAAVGSSTPAEPAPAIAALEARIAALEAALLARGLPDEDPCETRLVDPSHALEWTYSGCNRNVHRNTTQSVETCQNGTVTFYNVSANLFDIKISHPPDAWHFVCGMAADRPKVATCTLTYEEPARPEGPAWVEIRFDEVNFDGRACVPSTATIIGTYFYDFLTSDAGVYVFSATAAGK